MTPCCLKDSKLLHDALAVVPQPDYPPTYFGHRTHIMLLSLRAGVVQYAGQRTAEHAEHAAYVATLCL